MKYLITGGAGFIGSALIRHLITATEHQVVNFDKLTYAGSLLSLQDVEASPRYRFVQGDICDRDHVRAVLAAERPDKIIHLAAESHVDRSVDSPGVFIQTNIVGTYSLLELGLQYWESLEGAARSRFVFHHVSTDEVYGSLGPSGLFEEQSPYRPNSPYSASKAASDHLVRAWHKTFSLPVVVTNCSNNYGPYQFPEKLIPMMILNAVDGKPLPVYGDGAQIRDWLYVDDHARALLLVANEGTPGETYNIGGHNEKRNIEVVEGICSLVNELRGGNDRTLAALRALITHVEDRPGHDRRYAIDASKIASALGWTPVETFESGLRKTVAWYLAHRDWCTAIEQTGVARARRGLRR